MTGMENIVLKGKKIPFKAEIVLKEILAKAGLSVADISDVSRTFEEQALTIIHYYSQHGAAAAKQLYGNGPGGTAIRIYEANENKLSENQTIKEMASAMKKAIDNERMYGTQKHLMHTSDSHFVFDVKPSSISNKEAFVSAVRSHPKVSRFLYPGSNPPDKAYHIEIPK
jgi:hypothetical protein